MKKEFLIKARNYCRSDTCLYCPYQTECDENECTFDEMSDSQIDALAEDINSFSKKNLISFALFYYGPAIDLLSGEDQFKCRTIDGAFDYWEENVYE